MLVVLEATHPRGLTNEVRALAKRYFFFFFCHGQEMEEGVRGQARNILKGQGRRQCEDACWGDGKEDVP